MVEVFAEYDPETLSGRSESNRKVKGTIHWVPFEEALDVEVRLYDTLFKDEIPQEMEGEPFENLLNPSSEEIISHAKVEPFLASATLSTPYQFVRTGYFALDPDSSEDKLVFNRTVSLRDSWKKVAEK